MSRYRDITGYANVRMVHLDLLELSAPGRQTMTVIGMDVQNGIGRPSDFCFPGLSSNNNRRLMDNCLTYPGYSEPSVHHISEEDPVERFEALRESNRAANAKIRANKIIEEEELKKARAARAEKLIEEEQKSKEKAVKKKVKKQKQRERKRCVKLEKEEPDTENGKVTNSSQQSKGDSKAINGSFPKDNANSSKDQRTISETLEESLYFTASSDEDSEQESDSSTSEELDMSSSFVSKAALIVNRKLEQKEKKKNTVKEEKNPVKEETKVSKETQPPAKEQSNEVQNHIKENALTIESPRKMGFKDNIQTSTEFAGLGNKYASSGQFDLAINYFTEAIKYNPTEYKLFGNRSFCFEKMQTFEKSLTDAEVSLTMCPGWVKGLYRKGRALAGLKRYEEAAIAFKEVLKLDSSCVDAAQELMRVQITQLMGYGFTREQSSNALIIHGTVDKALEVLSELHWRPGTINGIHPTPSPPLPPAEMKNVTSLYPVPLARPSPPQSQEEPKQSVSNKPWVPVHNKPNVQTPNPVIKKATVDDQHEQEQELFPVWVGNLEKSVTETMVKDLFNRAGFVHSVKVLSYRRCAFINFTNPKHCKEAMKLFHGYLLMGVNIVVRYPDRLSRGMGISKSACNAEFLPDKECFFWRNVGCNRGASCRYRHIKENYRIDFGKKKTIPSE